MINVLILDDDPMVAEFNKRYLEEVEGFMLTGIADSVNSALEIIEKAPVDLILLDIYMAGKNGLELLKYIRETGQQKIDVILITAAADAESIQTALRLGAIDYIIKPFEFERFRHSLLKYKEKFYLLNKQETLNQEELDKKIFHQESKAVTALPKGLSQCTLKTIVAIIEQYKDAPFSTEEIAERSNISRVSVRKYLKFMSDIGVLGERMTYGPVGRPTYLYVFRPSRSTLLSKFL
ncbi:two-component system, CitB family, response regulator MalR [Evansella caseinilytica]|uniref:Two-component system, CitB family, response regulator MalR n=1 Tax=Evansella caseinilytica TaxID=1503961 RepID=A0A1H3TMD9_9BACI|nr:response regulator [Evansella caseinilytica]SDZ51462.1 two-component system, CitB family, response regulator MalR [Evansella caseinilytica]